MTAADAATIATASHLFDHAVRADWALHFLAQPNHHLCIAYSDGEPVGFISGAELTHPDKGTEMFLYELLVHDRLRRHGIGKALVAGLIEMARSKGCYGMWVLTDADNSAAIRTYRSAGASEQKDQVMFTWHLDS